MNKYFTGCKTKQELRKRYIELMKKYHPDNGGSTEICQEINKEYEYLVAKLPDMESTTQDKTRDTYSEQWKEKQRKATERSMSDLDAKLRDLICKVIGLNGVNIEVVGLWVWLDGVTFKYREIIKASGFTWSKARKKWYACPYYDIEGNYKHYRKDSFNTLRNRYGSDKITSPDLLDD